MSGYWTRRHFLRSAAAVNWVGPVGLVDAIQAAQLTTGKTDAATQLAGQLQQIEASHPRLHFNAQGRELIRQRARSTHRRYAQLLLADVEKNRHWLPPRVASLSALNEVALEHAAAFLTNAAMAFVLSEDREHWELTQRWAMAMCETPLDSAPLGDAKNFAKNYALGIYAAGLARAYDWLYSQWSKLQRHTIQTRIAQLVQRVYSGSFPETEKAFWWAGVHLHHDFWVPTGGYGEAALALLGEVDEAPLWAARAKQEFDTCFSWLGDDGAWAEGAADWCYALAPLLWFYGAWQSAVGDDLHHVPWLQQTAQFRLYHRLPDGSYVYLNDSFRSGRYGTSGSASSHLLRRLASLFRDSHAQWLADRDEILDLMPSVKGVYQAPYEGLSYHTQRIEYESTAAHCATWNLLWFDPSVKPKPPDDLPKCHWFNNQDLAILRTGWGHEAAVVSLACGPLAGQRCAKRVRQGKLQKGEVPSVPSYYHMHAAYNSFTLFAAGQYFIVPPGYARRGSGFQNTVAVNGADFSTDPGADVRLVGLVEGPDFSYAVGDATQGFLQDLGVAYYRRHLVLLSDCLVVYDDLRLLTRDNRNWNRFQWTVHSDPQQHVLSIDQGAALWQTRDGASACLRLHILEPQEFAWERATLQSRDGTPMLEALRMVRPEWYTTRMQVLAVLLWADYPVSPAMFQRAGYLAVTWPDRAERAAIGFTQSPLGKAPPRWLPTSDLPNRSLLMLSGNGNSLEYRRWDRSI